MNTADYTGLSATDIAAQVESGASSAREIVQQALDQIEATEPTANAFIHLDRKGALAAAEALDARIARGEPVGPLAGVPISVKDLTPVAGMPLTYGSKAFATNIAEEDAIPVARLRAAGAIILGKTTTPEFGHKPITESPLFGQTPNAFNPAFTSGGSSGGAGASVAWRQTPVSIGTDGGGSIRIPASVSGLYGLKATLGRIPNAQAGDLFANGSYIGPLARSLEDLKLVYQVMAGPADADPWAKAQGTPRPVAKPKIGYALKVGNAEVSPEVEAAFQDALRGLEEAGYDPCPVEIDFAGFEPAFLVLLETMLAQRLGQRIDAEAEKFDPTLVQTVARAASHSGMDVQWANEQRTGLYRKLEMLFSEIDYLVTPTLAEASLPIATNPHDPVWINGENCGRIRAAWYPYTFPMNLTGHPAMSVPIAWTGDNLPIGLHISGRWYDEIGLFSLAKQIAQASRFVLRPPSGL